MAIETDGDVLPDPPTATATREPEPLDFDASPDAGDDPDTVGGDNASDPVKEVGFDIEQETEDAANHAKTQQDEAGKSSTTAAAPPSPDGEEGEPAGGPPVSKEVMLLSQKLAKERKQNEQRFNDLGSKIDQLVEALQSGNGKGKEPTAAQQQQLDQAADDLKDELQALEESDELIGKPMAAALRKLNAKLSQPQTPAELKAIQDKIEELGKAQQAESKRREQESSAQSYAQHWTRFKQPIDKGGYGFDGQPIWENTLASVQSEYEGATEEVIQAVTKERFNRLVDDKVKELKAKSSPQTPSPTRTPKPSTGTETVSPSASGSRQAQPASNKRRTSDNALFG